jgi:hypothetical protein
MMSDAQLAYRCETCDAPPGVWCRSATGVTMSKLHQARHRPGARDEIAELARLIKRSAQGHGWCSTPPTRVAAYLLAQGVTLPTEIEGTKP